jgi:hypothetical protein
MDIRISRVSMERHKLKVQAVRAMTVEKMACREWLAELPRDAITKK